jgi:hypothetical protein
LTRRAQLLFGFEPMFEIPAFRLPAFNEDFVSAACDLFVGWYVGITHVFGHFCGLS